MKIEDHPAFADKLPRICYVLGGEKTPLKINEEFQVTNRASNYRIAEDGTFQYRNNNMLFFAFCETDTLCALINGTQHVIRRPQFSEDEKALMRLFVASGRPIFKPTKDDNRCVIAWDREEAVGSELPEGLLSQITEKFDAAAYLESETTK